MGCVRCGAKQVLRPIPEYVVSLGPDSDDRTAEVYFQKHVAVTYDGGGSDEFYVTHVVRLNFSLIHLLLSVEPDCLYIRRAQEKALYEAAF